jgi:hypothetical protein
VRQEWRQEATGDHTEWPEVKTVEKRSSRACAVVILGNERKAVLAVSGQSGGHLRRVSIYTALDLPLSLRNSVLPQFGHGLSVDAAVFELLGGFAFGAHVTALAGHGLSSSQCRCTSFHGRLV